MRLLCDGSVVFWFGVWVADEMGWGGLGPAKKYALHGGGSDNFWYLALEAI